MIDLWPKDITVSEVKTPAAIIKEQASLLGEKTHNLVKAEVSYVSGNSGTDENGFLYNFYLLAPALENYRYRLFTIKHDIELYPLKVYADDDIMYEVLPSAHEKIEVESEHDFIETIKKIFSAEKTKKILNAILAQSQQ